MSSELERNIDSYLFYGGAFPNLARGMKEVSYPTTYVPVKHKGHPHRIPVIVGDKAHFMIGPDGYDHDYDYSDEEAYEIRRASEDDE